MAALQLSALEVHETEDWRGLVDQVLHYHGRLGRDCSVAENRLGGKLAASYRETLARCRGVQVGLLHCGVVYSRGHLCSQKDFPGRLVFCSV